MRSIVPLNRQNPVYGGSAFDGVLSNVIRLGNQICIPVDVPNVIGMNVVAAVEVLAYLGFIVNIIPTIGGSYEGTVIAQDPVGIVSPVLNIPTGVTAEVDSSTQITISWDAYSV